MISRPVRTGVIAPSAINRLTPRLTLLQLAIATHVAMWSLSRFY